MITWQNILLYIGVAAIIFFLLKALTTNMLTNSQISLIVLIIMVLVILLLNQCTLCSKNKNKETFRNVGGIRSPSAPSVYRPSEPSVSKCPDYSNEDLENLKDDMDIDYNRYSAIKNQENNAKKRIRQGYVREMVYTTTNPINTVPLGSTLHDYTYLPPENWFRAYEQPPVCIIDQPSNVSPIADPSISGLIEFESENNIIAPMNIDHQYTRKVLNRQNGYAPKTPMDYAC